MKYLIYVLFFSMLTPLYGQPGDMVAIHKKMVERNAIALKKDPNNPKLIWERLELFYKSHIGLQTRPKATSKTNAMHTVYQDPLLADLNYLIENQFVIKSGRQTISLADFYFKRGQYYYESGYLENSLQDYESAMRQEPKYPLKQKICLALAAYYYNLDENYNNQNLEKALYYLNLVSSQGEEPVIYERYGRKKTDYFQREKILLLKTLQASTRLENYLKRIAKSHLLFYGKERKKSEEYQKSHSYTIKNSLSLGLDKLYEIALYYYKLGDYIKAKNIIEETITFIPKNINGYVYETYNYAKYYALLSQIHNTDLYRDVELEIENLLKSMGDPFQGMSSQTNKLYNRLETLLYEYPYNPKLHLAKAIYLRKVKYNRSYTQPEGNPYEYLNKSEALGLVDYRIHYLRAILLKKEKNYKEALIEINKAEALHSGHRNMYGLKLQLFWNLKDTSSNALKETKKLFENSKQSVDINIEEIIRRIDNL